MEAIIVTSESDLKRLIQEIMREELKYFAEVIPKEQPIQDETLMTRAEMAAYLKISLVTLADWVKRGLPCIKKGSRVLFQKSEVLAALKGHQPKPSGSKKNKRLPSSKI